MLIAMHHIRNVTVAVTPAAPLHYTSIQNTFLINTAAQYCTSAQCTYNVTMRRVGAAIASVEKQYVLHILSTYL